MGRDIFEDNVASWLQTKGYFVLIIILSLLILIKWCIPNRTMKISSMKEQEILRLKNDFISDDKEKALSAYISLFKIGYEAIPYLMEEANNIETSPIQITVPPIFSWRMPENYRQTKGTVVLYLIEAIRIKVVFHSAPIITCYQDFSWPEDVIKNQITNQNLAYHDYLKWWKEYQQTGDAKEGKEIVPWSGWNVNKRLFDYNEYLKEWIK